jgi:hypothetical protein
MTYRRSTFVDVGLTHHALVTGHARAREAVHEIHTRRAVAARSGGALCTSQTTTVNTSKLGEWRAAESLSGPNTNR